MNRNEREEQFLRKMFQGNLEPDQRLSSSFTEEVMGAVETRNRISWRNNIWLVGIVPLVLIAVILAALYLLHHLGIEYYNLNILFKDNILLMLGILIYVQLARSIVILIIFGAQNSKARTFIEGLLNYENRIKSFG